MGRGALWAILVGSAAAQATFTEDAAPPGLRAWLGKDSCHEPRWAAFHAELSEAVSSFDQNGAVSTLARIAGELLAPLVSDPFVAFECGTAVASAFFLGAQCCDHLQLPLLAARLRQLAAIFASFDYQMKGEEYIDQSPWPINWMDGMEAILRSMMYTKQHEQLLDSLWNEPLRRVLAAAPGRKSSQQIAIVSVCDYDHGATPLARLSRLNKERYAQRYGYKIIIHEQAPVYEDPLSGLFSEPQSHRPAAWSKVDAVLEALATGKYDWVLWMDCDSFFMDLEVSLEEVVGLVEEVRCPGEPVAGPAGEDRGRLKALVSRWQQGPPAEQRGDDGAVRRWYEELLEESWQEEVVRVAGGGGVCTPCSDAPCGYGGELPTNQSLGWGDWLRYARRPELIASEDGLMLNTGIVLARASPWVWQFFQKVRWMTFGRSPVTQHPWWEQTAMIYLLQLPFTVAHAARQVQLPMPTDLGAPGSLERGYAPGCTLLSQRHLNTYPPLVASALKTYEAYRDGDFIVSFSGCKVYSSQEVCNQLFFNYFVRAHGIHEVETDPALRAWL